LCDVVSGQLFIFPEIPVGDLRERATEKRSVTVLVIGSNGHWRRPTDPYAPERGRDVAIADRSARRQYDRPPISDAVTPIAPIERRIECLNQLTRRQIHLFFRVICGYQFVHSFICAFTRQFKTRVLDRLVPKLGTSESLKADGSQVDNQGIDKEARDCDVKSKMLFHLSSTEQVVYGFR
jgi:hypothetical protein